MLPATAIYYGKTCISASPGFGLQLIKEGILLPNLHAWMKTFYKKENESCTTVVQCFKDTSGFYKVGSIT